MLFSEPSTSFIIKKDLLKNSTPNIVAISKYKLPEYPNSHGRYEHGTNKNE